MELWSCLLDVRIRDERVSHIVASRESERGGQVAGHDARSKGNFLATRFAPELAQIVVVLL